MNPSPLALNTSQLAELRAKAVALLQQNDAGAWTRPAPGMYPHQWLWDSCFIAIGLAHVNPQRAAIELEGLLRGQWANGMMPHMIYASAWPAKLESGMWKTASLSPAGIRTSGITQPPLLGVAVERVAGVLGEAERQSFLARMVPAVIRYHEWLYRERDPEKTGLVTIVHPWESGMDDSPPFTEAMANVPRVKNIWSKLYGLRFRHRDERARPIDLQRFMALVKILSSFGFNSRKMLEEGPFRVRDMSFNAMLAASNESLVRLAATAVIPVPLELTRRMGETRKALAAAWYFDKGPYYSYEVSFGAYLAIPTVGSFTPLFAGIPSTEQTAQLVIMLNNHETYGTRFGIPSVSSAELLFERQRYWRGPVWVNMNWLIIQGLRRYGHNETANKLRDQTLALVAGQGFREYYDPMTGAGLGAKNFSWTAAVVLDLLADK